MSYGKILPSKKLRKDKKLTDKAKMMANKTTSPIPKTAKEKRMWIQARRFVAKTVGRYGEDDIPFGLVTKIYKDQQKSGHVMHDRDIENAKQYKSIRAYKTDASERAAKLKSLKKKYKN